MQELLEDFSRWQTGELITVPPESLEYVDLTALVLELQNRLHNTLAGEQDSLPKEGRGP